MNFDWSDIYAQCWEDAITWFLDTEATRLIAMAESVQWDWRGHPITLSAIVRTLDSMRQSAKVPTTDQGCIYTTYTGGFSYACTWGTDAKEGPWMYINIIWGLEVEGSHY